MDLSIKKLHFKFYKYIFRRPYPFYHWILLLTTYSKLWFFSIIFSLIFSFIFESTFVHYMKFYFVFNFFYMIFVIFKAYKLEFFRLIYDTIEQLFRMTIGRLFGLRPIDYNYKPQTQRNFLGKNILDFDTEGKYQTFGYEFIDNINVIRHAGSFAENDYYKNSGTYSITEQTINLDIEGDLFPRSIRIDTLELFIGVHFNNTLVCKCTKFEGNFNIYFKKLL